MPEQHEMSFAQYAAQADKAAELLAEGPARMSAMADEMAEQGWKVARSDDGGWIFTAPQGTPAPEPPRITAHEMAVTICRVLRNAVGASMVPGPPDGAHFKMHAPATGDVFLVTVERIEHHEH